MPGQRRSMAGLLAPAADAPAPSEAEGTPATPGAGEEDSARLHVVTPPAPVAAPVAVTATVEMEPEPGTAEGSTIAEPVAVSMPAAPVAAPTPLPPRQATPLPRAQPPVAPPVAASRPAPSAAPPAADPADPSRPARKNQRAGRNAWLDRKETFLYEDQRDDLSRIARRLNRARAGEGEAITDNTLIRVAIDLLLQRGGELHGRSERELLSLLSLRDRDQYGRFTQQ